MFVEYLKEHQEEMKESLVAVAHKATSQTPSLTDYRYVGKTPNNYVCLTDETPCPTNSLFRILGIYPTKVGEAYEERVKLIKPTSLGSYQWNTEDKGYWPNTSLYATLNNEYWSSLGDNQKYVAPTVWYIGAISDHSNSASVLYNEERGSVAGYDSHGITSYGANIGLMNPSDYALSLDGKETSIPDKNEGTFASGSWLFTGYEYLMNGYQTLYTYDSKRQAMGISYTGGLTRGIVNSGTNYAWKARPTFYLKRKSFYKSGDGTSENPYRIGIDY